jgi:predicted DNA-binding transcriptional regulator AlpA
MHNYEPPTDHRSQTQTDTSPEPSDQKENTKDRPGVDKYKTNIDQSKYMLVEEAAKFCDAKKEIIWGFVEDDILDAYHTEYGIRFRKEDVRETCSEEDEETQSKYLTIDQAADYCATDRKVIWQYLEDGTLTSHQSEDGIRVPRKEVEETCDRKGDDSMD